MMLCVCVGGDVSSAGAACATGDPAAPGDDAAAGGGEACAVTGLVGEDAAIGEDAAVGEDAASGAAVTSSSPGSPHPTKAAASRQTARVPPQNLTPAYSPLAVTLPLMSTSRYLHLPIL